MQWLSRFKTREEIFICLILTLLILGAYWRISSHDFISMDDGPYVTENVYVKSGINVDSVRWAFTNIDHMCWQPLTWLSHMLDCEWYGLNPGMHHRTNLFLHIINSVLLFLTLKKMTGSIRVCAFAAALFALHPINVDTVAWVSERKNLLSTFFLLLTILTYTDYVRKPSFFNYIRPLIFFAMGLMSKPMVVTLPFVLLLLDVWPLERFRYPESLAGGKNRAIGHFFRPWRNAQNAGNGSRGVLDLFHDKIPFFLLMGAYLILMSFSLERMGERVSYTQIPFDLRVANGVVSYINYIDKLIRPQGMAVYYPFPTHVPLWTALLSGMTLAGFTIFAFRVIRRRPYFFTGWLWFLGTLLPVIGLRQEGLWPAMADRWAYMPFIGLYMILAWGGSAIIAHWPVIRKIVVMVGVGFLFIMLPITWMQSGYWKNSVTLFTHTLDVTQDNYVVHNDLGIALVREGRSDEAFSFFLKALEINPGYYKTHLNLGAHYLLKENTNQAIEHFQKTIEINPKSERAYNNLGWVMLKQGKKEEALIHFKKALTLKSNFEAARRNIERVTGQIDKNEP